jgi:hypothetical protein
MNSQNLPTPKRGALGGQIWGPDLHSLNPEILPSYIEISISNHLSCHMVIFLIYRVVVVVSTQVSFEAPF